MISQHHMNKYTIKTQKLIYYKNKDQNKNKKINQKIKINMPNKLHNIEESIYYLQHSLIKIY